MKRIRRPFIVTALILAAALYAATGGTSAQNTSETYAIRNARIVTVTGPVIENGTVVISGGKITAVGANVSVPSGAKTIDGTNLSVYPGHDRFRHGAGLDRDQLGIGHS